MTLRLIFRLEKQNKKDFYTYYIIIGLRDGTIINSFYRNIKNDA